MSVLNITDKRKSVYKANKATQKGTETPWHVEFLADCKINAKHLSPEHLNIMRVIADYCFDILMKLNKRAPGFFSIDDLHILVGWYHWGLVRDKRRISDLKTSDDIVQRIVNFGIYKMNSLVTFREKSKRIEQAISQTMARKAAIEKEQRTTRQLSVVK